MDLYIAINGGLGKNVSFLRVVRHLKKIYKRIFVSSPYWDVFQSCSLIDGVYKNTEQRDFILEAIKNNGKIVIDRMYDDEQFIRKEIDYAAAWCKICNVKTAEPDEDIPLDRIYDVFPYMKKDIEMVDTTMSFYEDYIVVQFYGGQSPLDEPRDGNWNQKFYSQWDEPLKRHYPVEYAQKFINLYKEKYPNRGIIQYGLPNEPVLEGCEHFMIPYLNYYQIVKNEQCKGFVSIDSSLQHMVSGVKPGIVLWAHSLPESFGYKFNTNIVQECDRSGVFYFTALGPSGAHIDYISAEELLKQCFL